MATWWPWAIFVALLIPALFFPRALAPVYKYWMKFGLLLSRITTPIVLGILFFLVFLPMGLAMKLLGKDPMRRSLHSELKSYRIQRKTIDKKSMENPF